MFIKEGRVEEREYQKNIFDSAKDSNTLVILPTGLGKTIISVLMTDYRLGKFAGSKALFLAPTRPLVNQHYKTFSGIMNLDMGAVSGSTKKSDRKSLYETSQLIFATPQTIDHDIDSEIIDFSDFSLLVVDEAHHTIGNYAYVKIAKKFMAYSKHAVILGLTASPASDREKIKVICDNLGITNIEIRGEDDPDVKQYVKTKLVREIRIVLPKELQEITKSVRSLIQGQIESLQDIGLLKNAATSKINRVTILMLQKSLQKRMFAGNRTGYTIRGIITTSKILKLYHALNLVSTQSLESFNKFIERIIKHGTAKTDKELAKTPQFVELYETSSNLLEQGVEHPKLEKVVSILKESLGRDKRAIIFTQYRDSVDTIFSHLRGIDGVRPIKFIGQGRGGLSQKDQINIIKDFEAGVYNVLVSTSVSEEGISIKGADVAIFYETIPSGIRAIQRRGRVGRFDAGKIFILITENTSDEGYYWVAKRKESRMKKIIKDIKANPESLRNDGTLKGFI
jgi:Fanconi anemia group M protein